MIDVKKLTTYFLVLAGVLSLIAVAFSGPGFFPFPALTTQAPKAATARVPANGFVALAENLPPTLRTNLAGAETNITKATTENLAEVINGLNPYGPRTIDGQHAIVLPTTTILVGYLTMENPRFQISDLWISPNDEQILLASAADAGANRAYAEGFRDIMKQTVSSDAYLAALGNAGTAGVSQNFFAASALTFGTALQKLRALPTPPPFVEFQKNFLAYLEDQRNVFLVMGDPNDPLKSLMVLKSGDGVKQRIADDFALVLRARAALDTSLLISRSNSLPWSYIMAALTIPTANALSLSGLNPEDACSAGLLDGIKNFFTNIASLLTTVPVSDKSVESNTAGMLGILSFDCSSRILTQQTKKNLVDLMNRQTLASVQNGGDPRFITDWRAYEGDAGIRAATAAYQDLSPEICPQFQPYVDATVFSPSNVTNLPNDATGADLNNDTITADASGGNAPGGAGFNILGGFGANNVNGVGTGCGITSQVDTNAYYNDFTSDPNAWDDYFSLILDPSNNIFGTVAASRDIITGAAAGAAAGAQAAGIAAGGYKSDVNCIKYYTDDSGNKICTDQVVVTPGGTISAQSETAVNSRYDAIVNADDLAQIDSELADGLGTQLEQRPQQGLYELAVNTGNSLASVCSNLAPPSIASLPGGSAISGIPGVPGIPSIPGLSSAQSACNSILGTIIGQFNKYLSLITNITSILSKFGF